MAKLPKQRNSGPRPGGAGSQSSPPASNFNAKFYLVPGEKASDLTALVTEYYRFWEPNGTAFQCMVEQLVIAEWRLRRYRRTEAGLQRIIDTVEQGRLRTIRMLQKMRAASGKGEPGFVPTPDQPHLQ